MTLPKAPAGSLLYAVACGILVANVYYAQPMVALIAPAIGLDQGAASLVVTLTQLGYGAGLILLAPLGDLVENRRLILATIAACLVALVLAALAGTVSQFLAAALLIGVFAVAVQMLIPLAAHLAPDQARGRVVGNIMAGLLAGIMLARPLASLIAHAAGWRAVFLVSAVLTALVLASLAARLPRFCPQGAGGYGRLLASLAPLLLQTPVLRRRAAYQGLQFAAFSLFWTAVPLELAGPDFGFDQQGIALFALAGAAGALVAPLAGRWADGGHGQRLTKTGLSGVAAGFVLAWAGIATRSPIVLALSAILLDVGVQLTMITGQRAIYALGPTARSRLNALYLALLFLGGAAGSAGASPVFTHLGWTGIALLGGFLPLAGLALFATEKQR